MAYSITEYIWFFIIYAFLGWCSEVAYQAVYKGKFINRGFLLGPVCPIYGFGMILLIFALKPIVDHIPLLFFGAVLFTSALEFITGFVLEKVFNQKWWDYSDMPFNIKGYICLSFSIVWGLAAVFILHIIHPSIAKLVSFLDHPIGTVLLAILLAYFFSDVIITVLGIMKIKKRLRILNEIAAQLKTYSDEIGMNIYKGMTAAVKRKNQVRHRLEVSKSDLEAALTKRKERIAKLKEKHEKLLKEKGFVHRHLEKAFPRIKERLSKMERDRKHK